MFPTMPIGFVKKKSAGGLQFIASDGIIFSATLNDLAVTIPGAVEQADILLAFAYQTIPSGNTGGITGPSSGGWTTLGEFTHADTNSKAEIFYKAAGPSEPNFNMQFAETIFLGDNRHQAGLLAFRSAGTPVSQSQTDGSSVQFPTESFTEPATTSFEVILIGAEDGLTEVTINSVTPGSFATLVNSFTDHGDFPGLAVGWRENTDSGAATMTVSLNTASDVIRYRVRVPEA